MVQLDQEDINFLEDLIEELPKIDGGVYKAEATELENILFRLTQVESECTNTDCKGYKFKNLKERWQVG